MPGLDSDLMGEAGDYDLLVVFSLGTKPDLCASQVEWVVYEEY